MGLHLHKKYLKLHFFFKPIWNKDKYKPGWIQVCSSDFKRKSHFLGPRKSFKGPRKSPPVPSEQFGLAKGTRVREGWEGAAAGGRGGDRQMDQQGPPQAQEIP